VAGFDPTFGASGVTHVGGSVPDPGAIAGSSRYLREDAIWAVPNAGPPGPPPPPPGPGLDQWACNAAGFIIYSCCYKLVKSVVDTNFFTLATLAIEGFIFDSLAEILLPLEILDSAFINWLEVTLQPFILGAITTFEAHLLDQVLWSKFHCFLYNEIRTAGVLSNTVLLAAGTALAASGISPTQVTNGVALILQQFGIMTIGPVPASAFVENYDCSTCAGTGTSSAPIPIQSSFDLTVTDGTNTAHNVNVLQVNHGVVGGDGNTATLTPQVGVQGNGSAIGTESSIDFVDSLSLTWILTDDPTHSRVLVSGTVPLTNWPVGYGPLSSRPGASQAGRLYYATDTHLLYRDNGSSWDTLTWDASEIASGLLASARGGLGIDSSAFVKGTILVNTGSAWVGDAPLADGLVLTSDHTTLGGVSWSAVGGAAFPVLALDYVANTDLWNGSIPTANTWEDVTPNQSFNVNSGSGHIQVMVNGVVGQSGGSNAGARIIIDSGGGTPVTKRFGGSFGTFQNIICAGDVVVTNLAAGSHTIKVQVYVTNAGALYCRCLSQPNTESMAITILDYT